MRVPGIEDGRCECRQGNQTFKHILLESRLFARQRRNLWTEEARKARKEGGRSLEIERILTDGPCSNLRKESGADWPVYEPPHRGQLMQRVHPNWDRRVADSFFNLGETGANGPEITPPQRQWYIK